MTDIPRRGALLPLVVYLLLVVGCLVVVTQDKGCRGDRVYKSAFQSKVPVTEAESQQINSCIDSRRWLVGIAGVVGAASAVGVLVGAQKLAYRYT